MEHTATGMEQSPVFKALMKKAAEAPMPELKGSPANPEPEGLPESPQSPRKAQPPPEGRKKPTQFQLPSGEIMPLLISGLILGAVWLSTEFKPTDYLNKGFM